MDAQANEGSGKPCLLVVDDEKDLLGIFSEFLDPGEYQLDLAGTGTEAIEMVRRNHYDLVVTDINLPGADGIAVLRAAREADPNIEVIVLTGNATTLTAIEALREGAYDYVTKPFDLYEMDQKIRKALERRALLADNRRHLDSLQAANAELSRHRDELARMVDAATRRLRTLLEVGKEITSILSLERTLRLILERSLVLTGASEGAVFLTEEPGGPLACRTGHGLSEAGGSCEDLSAALEGIHERVRAARRPEECSFTLPGLGRRGALVVPLLQEGQLTGTVVVLARDGGSFTEDDRELLVGLTAQASIAVHNATLYGRSRELERLKSEFVAVVSHELRTPLTAIKGTLELLTDAHYFQVAPQQEQLFSICQANVGRLEALVNDILDLSKLESSQLSSQFTAASIPTLMHNVVINLGNLAVKKEIRIRTECPDSLPMVRADELRIAQVLTNLLSNAIKFSPPSTEITLRVVEDRGGVTVEIRDQGIGIAPEDLPKLFSRFRQLDSSTTRKAGGTGLGLVISKGIVEEHNGRIWAESIPGKGSVFSFWLPAAAAETFAGDQAPAVSAAASAAERPD